MSHMQWRASIATDATVSLFRYYAQFVIMLFSHGSHHQRYNEVAVYISELRPVDYASSCSRYFTSTETVRPARVLEYYQLVMTHSRSRYSPLSGFKTTDPS